MTVEDAQQGSIVTNRGKAMSIGTGIAIAGVWVFAGIGVSGKHVTTSRAWDVMLVAMILTACLV